MRFTITIPKVKVDGKALEKSIFVKLFGQELSNTLFRLRRSIAGGKNAHGGDIKEGGYAESYKAAMKAGKVKRLGVTKPYSENVNLLISGQTLNAMQVRPSQGGNGQEIFFNSAEASTVAGALHERGFTGWFEYGQEDITRIEKAVTDVIDSAISKILIIEKE